MNVKMEREGSTNRNRSKGGGGSEEGVGTCWELQRQSNNKWKERQKGLLLLDWNVLYCFVGVGSQATHLPPISMKWSDSTGQDGRRPRRVPEMIHVPCNKSRFWSKSHHFIPKIVKKK